MGLGRLTKKVLAAGLPETNETKDKMNAKRIITTALTVLLFISMLTSASAQSSRMPTDPIGGQPPAGSKPSVKDLDYQVKYQRAFEAVLWGIPAVGIYPLRDLNEGNSIEEMKSLILESFEDYRQGLPDEMEHLLGKFRIVDFAYKVVGVGSVGTKCGVLLLEGRDRHDPLFLQIKQANKSVLEDHLPASRYPNSAERVVQGARLMQSATDIFMSWTASKINGNHFYWRQLKDWKGSANVESVDYKKLKRMAGFRGWALARSHSRSGDAVAISSYLGNGDEFDKAIAEFSARYADQNDQDYEAYMAEIRDSGLEVANAD